MTKLQDMDDTKLAQHQSGYKPEAYNYILCEKEWQRRAMQKQHEYDLELITEQVRWMKFSALLGVLGVILGAVAGAFLSTYLMQ